MAVRKMKMTTNARLVGDVLPSKRNTFYALKELINNSIKAKAKRIYIDFIPFGEEESLSYRKIDKIIIADDGEGVSESQFANRIMEIATESPEGGNGTGRFAGLLIGRTMHIETTAFDSEQKKNIKTSVTFNVKDFAHGNINDIELEVSSSEVDDKSSSEYKVTLSDLYNNEQECPRKNKLSSEFREEYFTQAIFEHYPFYVFNENVRFFINGKELKMENFFLNGKKKYKEVNYTDALGEEHKVSFLFYPLNLSDKRVRIFLQPAIGIKTIIAEFVYNSIWYAPEVMGAQFVVVESDIITPELYADFSIETFGHNEWGAFSKLIRDTIDEQFKEGDVKYKTFLEKLGADKYYPYSLDERKKKLYSEQIFERSAYLFEDELKLLSTDNKTRKIIYLLLRKAIENGDLAYLFSEVLNLSKVGQDKLIELLRQTDMEEIVRFSSDVAEREQFINFLYELTYGDISQYILERKQLHKIVEKNLWIFGEEYLGTPVLWSDKNLSNNLEQLRDKYLNYKPTKKDGNSIEGLGKKSKSITDLFFYNEKKLGNGRREVMIVELKAPNCAINEKELNQVGRYGFEIASKSEFPKHLVTYKILLISSKITDYGRSLINSNGLNKSVPFLYKKIADNNSDIQIYVMEWSELINTNRMHLSYLNNSLDVRYKDVYDVFQKDYSELMIPNRIPRLYESKKI
ncbi:MAG: ATP-binding protein [Bacteroidaceae bacterium]|nr:ATP-binding protein [Bacteroidaceae bacterium]